MIPLTMPTDVVGMIVAVTFGSLALVSLAIGWQLLRRVVLDRRRQRGGQQKQGCDFFHFQIRRRQPPLSNRLVTWLQRPQ